ncbi:4'-phosphopantetheinyl transferase family protein [Kitasatospora sp. NPDC050543]|uniref:4'-phosphopantetheinyl transferase family protein n=1 Tax=Kitasatospora sp. NPDC050543 TaxID=3364054 RepID=UPI0037A0AFF0
MDSGTDDRNSPLAAVAASDAVLRHPGMGDQLLTAVERERADRFRHESGRRDFVAAHLLVRLCAARLLGTDAASLTLAQHCPGCGRSGHGRPYLSQHPDVHVSLSHTRGVVAAAAAGQPVGIDVELPSRGGSPVEVLERVLTGRELKQVKQHPDPARAFLRQWVRKEAMVKIGRTTLDTLDEIDLSALPVDLPDGAPLLSRFGDLHLLDWSQGEPHPAMVSVVGSAAPRLLTAEVLGA